MTGRVVPFLAVFACGLTGCGSSPGGGTGAPATPGVYSGGGVAVPDAGAVAADSGGGGASACPEGVACLGTDRKCYGPCITGTCTTSPAAGDTCSAPSAGGVSCCTTPSGGGGGGGEDLCLAPTGKTDCCSTKAHPAWKDFECAGSLLTPINGCKGSGVQECQRTQFGQATSPSGTGATVFCCLGYDTATEFFPTPHVACPADLLAAGAVCVGNTAGCLVDDNTAKMTVLHGICHACCAGDPATVDPDPGYCEKMCRQHTGM